MPPEGGISPIPQTVKMLLVSDVADLVQSPDFLAN